MLKLLLPCAGASVSWTEECLVLQSFLPWRAMSHIACRSESLGGAPQQFFCWPYVFRSFDLAWREADSTAVLQLLSS